MIEPGAGSVLTNPVGGQMTRKVADQDTRDAYSLFENWMPAQSPGPLPHIHFLHD